MSALPNIGLVAGALLGVAAACNLTSGSDLDPSSVLHAQAPGGRGPDGELADGGKPVQVDGGDGRILPEVRAHGGAPLAGVELVTVTYEGDPLRERIDAFGATITKSDWWSATTSEYGVLAGKAPTALHLSPAPAPGTVVHLGSDANELQSLVRAEIQKGHIAAPTAETMLGFYTPPSVQLVTADGKVGCKDFRGYHGTLTASAGASTVIPYFVIPRCDIDVALSAEEAITHVASRLLVNTATNPRPVDAPGLLLESASYPALLVGALAAPRIEELGNLCPAPFAGGQVGTTRESTFVVARTWSNANAQAGKNPCVPVPTAEPYVNVVPVDGPDSAVSLHVGDSVTLRIRAISQGEIPEWNLRGVDVGEMYGATGAPYLKVEVTPPRVTAFGTTEVKLTLLRPPSAGSRAYYAVVSKDPSGRQFYLPGEVFAIP